MIKIKKSPDRLILTNRPLVLGIGLAIGILIVAAIGLDALFSGRPAEAGKLALVLAVFALVFAVFVRQISVLFDRPSQTVTIRTTTVFGRKDVQHSLLGLPRAEKEQRSVWGRNGTIPNWRPVLVFPGGEKLPLTTIFESGPNAQTAVTAINAWLGRPKT